jgi:hypothetical protein
MSRTRQWTVPKIEPARQNAAFAAHQLEMPSISLIGWKAINYTFQFALPVINRIVKGS